MNGPSSRHCGMPPKDARAVIAPEVEAEQDPYVTLSQLYRYRESESTGHRKDFEQRRSRMLAKKASGGMPRVPGTSYLIPVDN